MPSEAQKRLSREQLPVVVGAHKAVRERHGEVHAEGARPDEVEERERRCREQGEKSRRQERRREAALPESHGLAGIGLGRTDAWGCREDHPRRETCSRLAAHHWLDAPLRLVERHLGGRLPGQCGLYSGRKRIADGGPLRHARTPIDVGIVLQ